MPSGLATSRAAPVCEIFRITQSIAPPLNSMVPAFNTRCLGARFCSGFPCVAGCCRGASSAACFNATAMSASVKVALILLQAALNLAPANNEIRLHLATAMIKTGDKVGARRELEALIKLEKTSPLRAYAEKLLSGI